jgi:hypothetical protein
MFERSIYAHGFLRFISTYAQRRLAISASFDSFLLPCDMTARFLVAGLHGIHFYAAF